MISLLWRAWRLVATAIAFLTFGVGGLLLQVVGMPLLYVLFRKREQRRKVARRGVHLLFWVYVRFMAVLGIFHFRVEGAVRLKRPGLVIVANHPTLLDVVFLLSLVPDATCIVRAGLAENPFTRAAVQSAGYVCNDSGVELVDACVRALQAGSSLIVFPEGTRTDPSQQRKWHRGAANMALRANVPLTPVWIRCQPPSLRKGEPWWRIPSRQMRFHLKVLDDLAVTGGSDRWATDFQAARGLTDQIRGLLTDRAGAMQELEHEIKVLIIESLNLEDVAVADIDSEAPLFVEGLGLDSIDALELGLVIQKRYGVKMSDSEENRKHFASVRQLAAFVADLRKR